MSGIYKEGVQSTQWGDIYLDFVHYSYSRQSEELKNKSAFDVAKGLSIVDENQYKELLDSGLDNNTKSISMLFPNLSESIVEVDVLKGGFFHVFGLYRYEMFPNILSNSDILDYLYDSEMVVVDFNGNPAICCSDIEKLRGLKNDYQTSDVDNPLVLWLKTQSEQPIFSYSRPPQLKDKLDKLSMKERTKASKESAVFFKLDELPETMYPLQQCLQECERNHIHSVSFDSEGQSILNVKTITRDGVIKMNIMDKFDPQEIYKSIQTLFQLVNVGMRTVNTTTVKSSIVIEYTDSEFYIDSEMSIKINSSPSNNGFTLNLDILFSSEIERELDDNQDFDLQGISLVYDDNSNELVKGLCRGINALYHDKSGFKALAFEESFPLYVEGITHISIDEDINNKLLDYISCGYEILIIGEIKSPSSAYLSIVAEKLGFKVICGIKSKSFQSSVNRIISLSSMFEEKRMNIDISKEDSFFSLCLGGE